MSRWYRLLYRIGLTPWESDTATLAPEIETLLAREEARRGQPFGRALDMGCGTGRWSVELARRGWQVVGVDVVPRAVRAAAGRARAAGVDASFVEGDVTALRDAGIDAGFALFLDVECFNHLNDVQRQAMGREVDAVAAPGATLLLLAWAPGRRTAFPGWRIVDEQAYGGELPRPLRRVAPRWYTLARA